MGKLQDDEQEILGIANDWRIDHGGNYLIDKYLPESCRLPHLGMAGVGKTIVCLDQGLHLSLGIDWMGQKVKKSKVLWLNLNDESKESTSSTIERLLRGLGLGPKDKPPNFVIIQQCDWINRTDGDDRYFDLTSTQGKEDVRWLLYATQPNVVYIDSLRKFLPIKKQIMEVEPFSALFNEFKPIAICPLTHAQQKGITSGDLFRADDPLSFIANSSDLAREIDCLSVLDNELNDDGKVIRFFMKYKVKRMYHVDGVPFVINLKQTPDMLRLEYGGEYVEPLEPALRIILDILNDNYERHDPNSPALAMEDIIEASNGNVNKGTTAYRHMITLEKDGYIRLVSRRLNKYLWTITSKGRKNLGIIDTICSEPEGDEKVHLATGKTWSQEKKQAAKKAAKEGKGSKNSESKKAEDGNNRH